MSWRRTVLRQLAIAALSLATVMGGVILGVTGLPKRAPLVPRALAEAPSPPPRVTANVVDRVRLAGIPGSIAVERGSVWVVTDDRGQGAVAHVDAATDRVVATVQVDAVPEYLAAGAGAAWAPVVLHGKRPALLRIDGRTNEVTGRVDGVTGPVVVDSTGVWAVQKGQDAGNVAIVRIDPTTLRIEMRVSVGDVPFDLAAGSGTIWVLGRELSGGDAPPEPLIHVDGRSGSTKAVDLTSAGIWLAANRSGVWLDVWKPAPPNGSVALFVDASTGKVSGKPGAVSNFRPFAVAEGRVWFISGPEDPGLPKGGICGLNVVTRLVDACVEPESIADLELAHDPAAFDQTTHSIWIGAYESPWVSRIDVTPAS